jgi:hypothetical protein
MFVVSDPRRLPADFIQRPLPIAGEIRLLRRPVALALRQFGAGFEQLGSSRHHLDAGVISLPADTWSCRNRVPQVGLETGDLCESFARHGRPVECDSTSTRAGLSQTSIPGCGRRLSRRPCETRVDERALTPARASGFRPGRWSPKSSRFVPFATSASCPLLVARCRRARFAIKRRSAVRDVASRSISCVRRSGDPRRGSAQSAPRVGGGGLRLTAVIPTAPSPKTSVATASTGAVDTAG